MATTIATLETLAVRALSMADMSHLLTPPLADDFLLGADLFSDAGVSPPAHAWHRFHDVQEATPLPHKGGLARVMNGQNRGRPRMHVVIDRATYEFPAGWSVLDGLRAAGIHLPAMCHDDRIIPVRGMPSLPRERQGMEQTRSGVHDGAQ